ncbi:MAG TPA: hypothetical protein ENN31_00465 [Candidatus Vogelbacteria bacterium]|nr:hypothetical protein [Candidatus Vogelbacteria bacterium]
MKKVEKFLKLSIVFFIFFVLFLALFIPFEEIKAFDWPEGLTIKPAKTEVSLLADEDFSGLVRLINNQPIDLFVEVKVEDLSIWDGLQEIYPLSLVDNYSPQDFIKPAYNSFYIKAQEEFVLPVDISLPDFLPAGSYYGVLMFSVTSANQPSSQAKVITRLGSVFLIRLEGNNIKEEGRIINLSLYDSKKITTELPQYFEVVFKNTGNVHLNPAGRIEIFRFGQLIGEVPVGIFPAYPGLDNRIKVLWSSPLQSDFSKIGFYQANLRMYLGYGNEYQEFKTFFIVMPKTILIPILIILSFIFLGLFFKLFSRLFKN